MGAFHSPCLQEADGVVSASLAPLSPSHQHLVVFNSCQNSKKVKSFVRKSEIDRVERLIEESSI